MKHLGVYTIVSIMLIAVFGGFTVPEKGYASVTANELSNLINDAQNFSQINQSWTDRYVSMVNSVAGLYKNDPKVNVYQVKQYVLQGVPGSQIPDQQGFIPMLNGVISGGGDASLARIALASANIMLASAVANDQKLKGIITEEQAAGNIKNASQTNSAALYTELRDRSQAACSFLSEDPLINCIDVGLSWLVKSVLLEFTGWLLWASANLLNYAMYHGVFFFKNFAPDGIYAIWTIVKQIVTLFVFFAALFVGFMAIIGKSEEFKRYIVFLVFFGLFVNFSYPLVRIPIDLSNIVSLQIYQSTLGGEILSDNPASGSTAGARIITSLGLQGLFAGVTSTDPPKSQFLSQIRTLPGALAALVFTGLAAYVLFMCAVLIISRTAILVVIIAASSLLLLDTVVPGLGERAKWLRGVFISQIFVAPVFTIMLALTLKFLEIFSLTSSDTSSAVVFFNLILMITMLFIMLKVTKATAGSIGETVTKWAGKAGGLGTGVALGAGAATFGFAGRNTVGRFANAMSERVTGGGLGSELLKKGLQGVGRYNYDARNSNLVQSGAGQLGISGMGQGVKKGVKELDKERNAANTEFAKDIVDDGERETFLQRKFNNKAFGSVNIPLVSKENSKPYTNFVREDEKLVKQYASANEAERKEMKEDDKNKRFMQRFSKVEDFEKETDQNKKNQLLAQMSPEMQKAVQDKETKKKADKTRDEENIASYASVDQSTRNGMIRGAQNNPELLKNLNLMEQMRQVDNTANDAVAKKIELLKQLNNDELAKKVIAQDIHKGLNGVDAVNQKRSMYEEYEKYKKEESPTYQAQPAPEPAKLKQEYDEAVASSATTGTIKQAQLQAAQTQAEAAQAMTQAAEAIKNAMQPTPPPVQPQIPSSQDTLTKLARQNDDLLDILQKMIPKGSTKTPLTSVTGVDTGDSDSAAVKVGVPA